MTSPAGLTGLNGHHHGGSVHAPARKAGPSLRIALIITSTVFVAEFFGGIYSNSLALMADAGHMLTDVAALGLSFFALWFSSRPATPSKTWGFYRVEILAALANGVFLVLIAVYVLYEAYTRLFDPPEVRAELMLMVAALGLVANLASAYVLFGKQSESLNVRGAFFHVLSDALGSVGAIGASLVMMFFGWNAADPIISAFVAVLILSSSWILIRDATDILLEGTPSHINLATLKDNLARAEGVRSIHDLHVWTLTSGVVAMSCHAVVDGGSVPASELLARIQEIASERFRIDHTTIQVEQVEDGADLGSCNCHFGAV